MIIKYNIDIQENTIRDNLKRIINQIYKLLPNREEGVDWIKPLETIMEELAGMSRLFCEYTNQQLFFTLICKLEGLYSLSKEGDFALFRRTIFECLSLTGELQKCLVQMN